VRRRVRGCRRRSGSPPHWSGAATTTRSGHHPDDDSVSPDRLLQCPFMPRPEGRYRYRTARQHHIGDALEALETRGLIGAWRLVFAHPLRRKRSEVDRGASPLACWCITDDIRQQLRTRDAEEYISGRCSENGIEWLPVPPPGGVEAAQPVRELLAIRASHGHDVLAYTAIAEHLRWAGVSVPPVGG